MAVLRSRAWRAGRWSVADAVPVELLDARELDPAWVEINFDDSSWAAATVLKASHGGALGESALRSTPTRCCPGIGMLGGSRVVAPSVIVQMQSAVADLPDHPLRGWSSNCGKQVISGRSSCRSPSPAAKMQRLWSRQLRPDRRGSRRTGGRSPEWCAA